ncbi:MAG: Gfo/Idh/MocA family oxidoreductase [Treponema sp.]|jgi:predicted dehydrogenase|nr:Gfo/Idh/MocA family oxidoreductase [Treponema sp.]
MDKVRLGIIGIGNMGSSHGKNIIEGKVPGITLAAVADLRAERRDWAAENLGRDVRVYTDGRELIAGGLCDAVLISVPHYDHPVFAIEAFKAGLHVLCEKPAGVYTKQVREMNHAAEASGLVFALMFNQRTNGLYREMRRIVAEGELGAIKRVNWIITDWYRTQNYYDSGDWRATWTGEGGGVLLNQCPHQLDLFQWICGMPKKVRAFCHEGKWHNIEVEDDVTAYFEYPNGATGTFITSTADAPGTNRFEITGEMGKLVCENNELLFSKLEENERSFCKNAKSGFGAPPYAILKIAPVGGNEQHIGVLKAFADRILHGGPLVADGAEGIWELTLSNAMYLSSWLDTTITLPLDEDLFLAELNKRRAASRHKVGSGQVFAV